MTEIRKVNVNLQNKLIFDWWRIKIYKDKLNLIPFISVYNFFLLKLNLFLVRNKFTKLKIENNLKTHDVKISLYDNYFYNLEDFISENSNDKDITTLESAIFYDKEISLDHIANISNQIFHLNKHNRFIRNLIQIPKFLDIIILKNKLNDKIINIIIDRSKSNFNFNQKKKEIIFNIIDIIADDIFAEFYIKNNSTINENLIKEKLDKNVDNNMNDIIEDIINLFKLIS